mmetsp:Transcript_15966/g.50046  ORF Transcript_15966/g.50046 Transcript_15966/m.50046 type:complete len:328 (+) Transcript_15966:265-1248(+)
MGRSDRAQRRTGCPASQVGLRESEEARIGASQTGQGGRRSRSLLARKRERAAARASGAGKRAASRCARCGSPTWPRAVWSRPSSSRSILRSRRRFAAQGPTQRKSSFRSAGASRGKVSVPRSLETILSVRPASCRLTASTGTRSRRAQQRCDGEIARPKVGPSGRLATRSQVGRAQTHMSPFVEHAQATESSPATLATGRASGRGSETTAFEARKTTASEAEAAASAVASPIAATKCTYRPSASRSVSPDRQRRPSVVPTSSVSSEAHADALAAGELSRFAEAPSQTSMPSSLDSARRGPHAASVYLARSSVCTTGHSNPDVGLGGS